MASKYTTTFPAMGTAAYALPAGGTLRPGDMRPGMVVPKKGAGVGGSNPDAGTAVRRRQVMQPTSGAAYRITVNRRYEYTDANVQANGRIMPSAIGTKMNFRGGQGPAG
jgi:hypothetical protein